MYAAVFEENKKKYTSSKIHDYKLHVFYPRILKFPQYFSINTIQVIVLRHNLPPESFVKDTFTQMSTYFC